MATPTVQVRIESLPTTSGGWTVQKFDISQNPPKLLSKKFVTLGELTNMFTQSTIVDTGWTDPRVRRYARGKDGESFCLIDPGKIRPIVLYEDGKKNPIPVWVPPAMWIINTTSTRSNKWDAHVMLVGPDMRCGQYPVSNTYQDGGICWGNVRLPSFKFPEEVGKVVDLFFASEFNGHTWNEDEDFFDWMRSFATKKVLEMTEEQRWEMLLGKLRKDHFHTTAEKFFQQAAL